MKDGKALPLKDVEIVVGEDKITFKIKKPSRDQSGVYQVKISNNQGEEVNDVNINMQGIQLSFKHLHLFAHHRRLIVENLLLRRAVPAQRRGRERDLPRLLRGLFQTFERRRWLAHHEIRDRAPRPQLEGAVGQRGRSNARREMLVQGSRPRCKEGVQVPYPSCEQTRLERARHVWKTGARQRSMGYNKTLPFDLLLQRSLQTNLLLLLVPQMSPVNRPTSR